MNALFKKTTTLTLTSDDVKGIISKYLQGFGYYVNYSDINLNAYLNGYSVPSFKDCTVTIVEEKET